MDTLGLQNATSPWARQGFFGPVTATLDWCEANYQFSYYIAELANSFSNLFTIALAFYGGGKIYEQGLPFRYVVGNAGVALVGIGSFAFHASLLYEAQLADELPMIYVAAMSLWLLFDTRPGFNLSSARTKYSVLAMIIFDVLFTYSYYSYRNPVYHQVVFASIVIGVAVRITYLLRWSPIANHVPASQKAAVGQVFGTGTFLFLLGFLIWNLDNIFCDTLTSWKRFVGWPAAFLLEGHSWWHVFTGAGTYMKSIGIQYISLCIKDNPQNYTLQWKLGMPYIHRADAKAKAKKL